MFLYKLLFISIIILKQNNGMILSFRSLLDEGGVDRLVSITRLKQRYSSRVVKFASQVLAALWVHQELRDAYKKTGWKVSIYSLFLVRK